MSNLKPGIILIPVHDGKARPCQIENTTDKKLSQAIATSAMIITIGKP